MKDIETFACNIYFFNIQRVGCSISTYLFSKLEIKYNWA